MAPQAAIGPGSLLGHHVAGMRTLLRNSNTTTCVIQGFIKSYMQNILLIALAKDQCKNFTILQLLSFALVVERV